MTIARKKTVRRPAKPAIEMPGNGDAISEIAPPHRIMQLAQISGQYPLGRVGSIRLRFERIISPRRNTTTVSGAKNAVADQAVSLPDPQVGTPMMVVRIKRGSGKCAHGRYKSSMAITRSVAL
jgi:hypothetical protein